MEAFMVDRSKKWTVEDYLQLEEELKCEILDGELLLSPTPSISHQRTLASLYQQLISFVNQQQAGELFFAPVDVYFNEENVYQPDLVFVSAARSSIIQEKGVMQAPISLLRLFHLPIVISTDTPRRQNMNNLGSRNIGSQIPPTRLWKFLP